MTGAVKIPSLTLKWSPAPGVMVRVSVKVMYLCAPCNQQAVSECQMSHLKLSVTGSRRNTSKASVCLMSPGLVNCL